MNFFKKMKKETFKVECVSEKILNNILNNFSEVDFIEKKREPDNIILSNHIKFKFRGIDFEIYKDLMPLITSINTLSLYFYQGTNKKKLHFKNEVNESLISLFVKLDIALDTIENENALEFFGEDFFKGAKD